MKSFDHWRVRNEANILRSEKKRTGNELPPNQVEAGGTYKTGPKQFKSQLEGLKSKLSHKEPQLDGLGDKGMDGVGKATFDTEPVKAGETPTISNGIPIGDLKGQFENNGYPPPPPPPKKQIRRPPPPPGSPKDLAEKARIAKIKKQQAYERSNPSGNPFGAHMSFESFKTYKEFQAVQQPMNPAVATGQQDMTGQPAAPAAPEIDTRGLPPAIMRYMDMSLKAASNLGPQKLRMLWSVMNQKMEELISNSGTSDSMANTMRNKQALNTRKGI